MNIYIGEPVVVSDMQGPAPDGFHVPLSTEWQAIYDAGVSLGAWNSSNGTNFSTYLKLPPAGFRSYNNLSLNNRESYGIYWSSTPYDANYVYDLIFGTSVVNPQNNNARSIGYSVRCIKDSPVTPTSSWTTLYQGSGSAGIFHNPTDGLISISSDGSTWYTLMDKNLGATTVYNYGDILTEANCGKIYQWGNNYGFSGDANYDVSQISQSSTQVDVTGYGPGNYYNSATWITKIPRQSSANDGNNLRGGVSQGTSTKSVEVKNIYIGDYGWKPGSNTLAYYTFDNQNLNDSSGNNNNATWYNGNGTYIATNDGYCANLGGSCAITLPFTLANRTNWTVNAWINIQGGGSGYNGILGNLSWSTGMLHSNIYGNSSIEVAVHGGNSVNSSVSFSTNTWYNLVLTKSGTTYSIYRNNSLLKSGASNNFTNSSTLYIGTTYNSSRCFNGYFDNVIIEDKTRTATEIADYYNQTKSNYGL